MTESQARTTPVFLVRAILAGGVVMLVGFAVFCLVDFSTRKATEKNYLRIANGMTYEEVVEIVGESSSRGGEGPPGTSAIAEVYNWSGGYSFRVYFDGPGGKVVGKHLW